ncbi:MAG TPA: STAS domain-containing protein [Solirubrobacterales bacterium]|nr:STAS domain-containing protein [Solirubrobacterales bacterium]
MATTLIRPGQAPAAPTMSRFALTSEEVEAGILELHPRGELDLAVADRLADSIAAACQDGYSVLVDLADLEFIDSTGIAVLIRGWAAQADEGLRLVAARPARQVKRVLELVGMSDHGVVFADRAEALEALRR